MQEKKETNKKYRTVICRICGKSFQTAGYHTFYCEPCRKLRRKETANKTYHKRKQTGIPLEAMPAEDEKVAIVINQRELKKIYSMGMTPAEFVKNSLKKEKKKSKSKKTGS